MAFSENELHRYKPDARKPGIEIRNGITGYG
jgi:hypothetical protein